MAYSLNRESRNIILCSDGTGNRGGYTPDSNVFKLYKALSRNGSPSQIVFYDNGVGTSTHRYLSALAGAFGFGFKRNVCDLYAFLARNYRPGDRIFLFGFSRGAATVRALSGFVATCGLLDGSSLTDDDLAAQTARKFRQYRDGQPDLAEPGLHAPVGIEFIGVWDTVSALGFPRRTDISSTFLFLLNWLFVLLERLSNKVSWLRHNFYRYGITHNVKKACQALALDDARTAFWPEVWHQRRGQVTDVRQVWFAGAHANVGGGYKRRGLADVALKWMIAQAIPSGLRLKPGFLAALDADNNRHGKLNDSRDGLGMLYRYHPRQLSAELYLARHDARTPVDIHIHESVMERLYYRTANYAPVSLPGRFSVVNDSGETTARVDATESEAWRDARRVLDRCIGSGKWFYGMMLEFVLLLGAGACWLWIAPPDSIRETLARLPPKQRLPCNCAVPDQGALVDVLNVVTPSLFENLVTWSVVVHPWAGVAVLAIFTAGFLLNRFIVRQTKAAAERLALIVREHYIIAVTRDAGG